MEDIVLNLVISSSLDINKGPSNNVWRKTQSNSFIERFTEISIENLNTVKLGILPRTYSMLLVLVEMRFDEYFINNIAYKVSDKGFVYIAGDEDLKKAYATGCRVHGSLQLFISASKKISKKACGKINTLDKTILESPPDVIQEKYLVPCYKCSPLHKNCLKCHGSGVLNVYENPKLLAIHSIIKAEIKNYMPKLQQNSVIIHKNINCNNCGAIPIIGSRYKCSVCLNYDFCQICEKTTPHSHPFIKIPTPELTPKVIICAVDDSKKKYFKPKNLQPKPPPRLLCRFVRDIQGNNNDIYPPGINFTKTWRLRNDGFTPWPMKCKLVFNNGDFRGNNIYLPCLKPGEESDVSVICKSPDKDGRYYSYWRAVDPNENRFGQKLAIVINVQKVEEEKDDDLKALVEIFNNPELVKMAYEKAGKCPQKAAEMLLSGNFSNNYDV